MGEEYTDKSAWNLSQALLMEIQDLLRKASTYYLAGNLSNWFFCLKTIKMRIISNLNTEERQSLTRLERIINENAIQDSAKSKGSFQLFTEKYNELLFDLMEKYDLLLKKQKDRTRIN